MSVMKAFIYSLRREEYRVPSTTVNMLSPPASANCRIRWNWQPFFRGTMLWPARDEMFQKVTPPPWGPAMPRPPLLPVLCLSLLPLPVPFPGHSCCRRYGSTRIPPARRWPAPTAWRRCNRSAEFLALTRAFAACCRRAGTRRLPVGRSWPSKNTCTMATSCLSIRRSSHASSTLLGALDGPGQKKATIEW